MVNVPASVPYDNFRAPLVRDMSMDFGHFERTMAKMDKNSLNVKPKSEKYVDVLVPQTAPKHLGSLYEQQQAAQQQDDAIVPEFKAPAFKHQHQAKYRPAPVPVVPDLNFLDMDDWTSPFDLDLDFNSIMYEWEDQSVFNMPTHEATQLAPTMASPLSEVSEESEPKTETSDSEVAEPAQEQSKPEEDEFTRNRRLCLERYREKKRNRKFSKKVRYHLRKMNADRRPRYKGRFIKKGEVIPPELLD